MDGTSFINALLKGTVHLKIKLKIEATRIRMHLLIGNILLYMSHNEIRIQNGTRMAFKEFLERLNPDTPKLSRNFRKITLVEHKEQERKMKVAEMRML